MKDFAKSIHVGNAGGNLDAAAARDIREMAAKYWHSGIHDTRQLATTVAWEWAKKSKSVRDTTQDLVSEIKDIIDRSLNEIKTGNKKVGNALKYNSYSEATSKGMSDLEVFPIKRIKNSKTSNESLGEYMSKKPRVINEGKTGVEDFFKKLSDDVKEREKKDDADIEKVGNALNWDENLVGKFVWVKDKGQEWKVYVMQDKGDKVYIRDDEDGSQGWVSKTRITGKVGNSKTGNVQYQKVGKITIKLEANDDDWTVYDESGNELKSGKGGLGRAKTWAEHFARFTNKRTGNVASEYEILKQDPSKMHPTYKKAYEEAMKKLAREDEEFKKRFEKEYGVKNKNEASDDKFAYVMREFDEGKLKTPDGKVVTDPAQAKAIAYSESKKTENGLARARNAMNKKVANSSVREYKDGQGRIAQIDFNSDGTDADLAIYADERMSKSVEQKNFSTIRDAE